MKKFILLALAAMFLLTSCQKELGFKMKSSTEKDAANQINPVKFCDFIPTPGMFSKKQNHVCNTEKVFYIDFNGEYLTGTAWNQVYTNGNPVNLPASGLTASQKNQFLQTVINFFKGRSITVTTDRAKFNATPEEDRQMCVVSTESLPYFGVNWSGVAFMNSWGTGTPVLIFKNLFSANMLTAGRASIHELMHTIGEYHQAIYDNCNLVVEFRFGEGVGVFNSWCTIMGNFNQGNICTPFIGTPYLPDGCNLTQNDFAALDEFFPLKPDDFSNEINGSVSITNGAKEFVIETSGDVDMVKTTGQKPWVKVVSNNGHFAVDVYDNQGRYKQTLKSTNSLGLNMKIIISGNRNNVYYLKVRIADQGFMPRPDIAVGSGVISVSSQQVL
jgi:hypothetical protein